LLGVRVVKRGEQIPIESGGGDGKAGREKVLTVELRGAMRSN